MIQLKEVSLAYKRNKPVLDNLSLSLSKGHIYGLLGKNGEGKTTLLNIMCGQLFPDAGTCTVLGDQPSKRHAAFLQQVFLLPEELNMPDVKAHEYIEMYAPFYPSFSREILDACIEQLEIDMTARVKKMSQGQRKKVAITLALAAHTPLLLMDEPTNGLDIPSKSVFRKLVATYIGDDQTVIISTHQVRDLETLIDSVCILEKRNILLSRSLDEVAGKLAFRLIETGEPAFYTESTPMGLFGVMASHEHETTSVPLELLFNAVISNPTAINQLFNR